MVTIHLHEKSTQEVLNTLEQYNNHERITQISADILIRKLFWLYQEQQGIEHLYQDYHAQLNSENQLNDISRFLPLAYQQQLNKLRGDMFWKHITQHIDIIHELENILKTIDSKIELLRSTNMIQICDVIQDLYTHDVCIQTQCNQKKYPRLQHELNDNLISLY